MSDSVSFNLWGNLSKTQADAQILTPATRRSGPAAMPDLIRPGVKGGEQRYPR